MEECNNYLSQHSWSELSGSDWWRRVERPLLIGTPVTASTGELGPGDLSHYNIKFELNYVHFSAENGN